MATGPTRQLIPDRRESGEELAPPGVWLMIWTIYLAKLATIVLVIWASHSYQTTALVAATTWPWLAAAAALGAGPLIVHLRLRRVRAKRERLRAAEWMLGTHPLVTDGPVGAEPRSPDARPAKR